ncbi:MAG TPA: FAD-dependent oxidoreductase, partial [Candidatus Sulfotelmatobacter sp.]|nr:FAD-dependent oxidoreductase [Candidatus Sulfotelmatobacter sp.]
DDQAQLSQLRDYQLRLGLPVEPLRTAEARRAEPALSPFIRGAYLAEGDDQVDPRALLRALFVAATRAGVSFIRERVVAVTIQGERARGVWTECQRHIAAAVTVIAAGWSSPQIEGVPEEVRPPIRPVKGQLLHLRGEAAPPLLQRNLRALVRGSSVYLVPRGDGRIVVGATVEERGTDTRVTADAVYTLLRDAHAVLPGIDDLELAETVASLRPGSPDNAPLIGWSGCEALAYATGHHRNGVLLAPVTADAVVEMVSTGTTPELLTAFSPSRFRLHEPVGAAR